MSYIDPDYPKATFKSEAGRMRRAKMPALIGLPIGWLLTLLFGVNKGIGEYLLIVLPMFAVGAFSVWRDLNREDVDG